MKNMCFMCLMMVALMLLSGAGEATEVTLNQITFPERNQIEIGFVRDQGARGDDDCRGRISRGTGRNEHSLSER